MIEFPRAIDDQSFPIEWRLRLLTVVQIEQAFVEQSGRHSTAAEFARQIAEAKADAILREAGIADEVRDEQG